MGFGFVIARVGIWLSLVRGDAPGQTQSATLIGLALLLLGATCSALAAWRYWRIRGVLLAGRSPDVSSPAAEVGLAIALAALGVALAAYVLRS